MNLKVHYGLYLQVLRFLFQPVQWSNFLTQPTLFITNSMFGKKKDTHLNYLDGIPGRFIDKSNGMIALFYLRPIEWEEWIWGLVLINSEMKGNRNKEDIFYHKVNKYHIFKNI